MLARLQQVVVALQWLLALMLLGFLWVQGHPVWGVLAAIVVWLGHAPALALESVLLHRVNRGDPAPRATWAQLLRAWWGEVWAALRVFGWRQPFRSRAQPDVWPVDAQGRQGIVFVHGYVCNRGFWTPWLRQCQARGIPAMAINLEPVFGSIDAYAVTIDAAVQEMQRRTGRPPVLVCHSMGGLAARAWLRQYRAHDRVAQVVTIGSPHHGTWLARWGHTCNVRQMRQDSEWLRQLRQAEAQVHPGGIAARVAFVCYYGHADNIVFPASTACLPGASCRFLPGVAHVAMAFLPEVMQDVLDALPAAAGVNTGAAHPVTAAARHAWRD